MEKTIQKFELAVPYIYNVPKDTEILSIGTEKGKLYIYFLVDPNAPKEERYFEAFKEGDIIPYLNNLVKRNFIGRFQKVEDYPVYHLFERVDLKS